MGDNPELKSEIDGFSWSEGRQKLMRPSGFGPPWDGGFVALWAFLFLAPPVDCVLGFLFGPGWVGADVCGDLIAVVDVVVQCRCVRVCRRNNDDGSNLNS